MLGRAVITVLKYGANVAVMGRKNRIVPVVVDRLA
jgi:hypothetical protein